MTVLIVLKVERVGCGKVWVGGGEENKDGGLERERREKQEEVKGRDGMGWRERIRRKELVFIGTPNGVCYVFATQE